MIRGTTLFLKTVFLIGISILALFILFLPWLVSEVAKMIPELAYLRYPVLIVLYAALIPFSFALYNTFKLFNCIKKNKACSELSVKALKNIKYCAIIISVLYVIGMPVLFLVAEIDDAPGLILFGFYVIIASLLSAVLAAFLQKRCH